MSGNGIAKRFRLSNITSRKDEHISKKKISWNNLVDEGEDDLSSFSTSFDGESLKKWIQNNQSKKKELIQMKFINLLCNVWTEMINLTRCKISKARIESIQFS